MAGIIMTSLEKAELGCKKHEEAGIGFKKKLTNLSSTPAYPFASR